MYKSFYVDILSIFCDMQLEGKSLSHKLSA